MYEIAVTFVITIMCVAVIPNMIVGYEHFCEFLDQRQYKKQLRTSLERDYQTWYTIVVNESDATEKGYAIARLIIIKNELENLDKKKTVRKISDGKNRCFMKNTYIAIIADSGGKVNGLEKIF